jgi:transcriptional regulator with XRE-family HTH domain
MPRTIGSPRHRALRALIVAKREESGLSQYDLADRLGVSQSQIASLERGQRRIDVVEFMELGEALGFDPIKVLRKLAKVRR